MRVKSGKEKAGLSQSLVRILTLFLYWRGKRFLDRRKNQPMGEVSTYEYTEEAVSELGGGRGGSDSREP